MVTASGVVYEYARITPGVAGTVRVLGVLPASYGRMAGAVVAELTIPEKDLDDGAMAMVEMHVEMNYGRRRTMALVR